MDNINSYRQIVKDLLTDYAKIPSSYGNIVRQTVFDQERDHYQLVNTGWENKRRIYGCLLHVDIQADGKIWIQYDGTEAGIANQLVEKGIPKENIVLAYQSTYMRKLSEFAAS